MEQPRVVGPTPRAGSVAFRPRLGPGTAWLTGLPGAGKSSVGAALAGLLSDGGNAAIHLDGDELRKSLCSDLGFDRESRRENVRRVAELAKLFAGQGVITVVSLVSPFRADRDAARALHEHSGVPFVEVWLNTPIAECERRDPKRLYERARRGELHRMTGVDDPYEPPLSPELVLGPENGDPVQCATLILDALALSGGRVAASSRRHG